MERKLPFQQKIEATQSAANLYKTFNEEQKQFAATQQIKGKHKIKHWMELLEKVALWDEKADKARPIGPSIGRTLSLFMAIMGLPLGIFGFVAALHWLIAVGAGAFIVFLMIYLGLRGKEEDDIRNHFRLFVMPLLYVLREEAGEDAKLKMRLDFSHPDKSAYKAKAPAYIRKVPADTIVNYYAVTWLELELELADGALLAIELSDFVRNSTRRRRNPRGKLKVKEKRKIKHSIKTVLSFPKTHYQISDTPTKAQRQDSSTHFVVQAKQKQVQYQNHIHQDLLPLLVCLSECYKTVRPL